MLLYIGFNAFGIYLKKIPIIDVLKRKVVNPEEGMQPIGKKRLVTLESFPIM